jgi:ABC-type lipoprotein release transport system permease subunit
MAEAFETYEGLSAVIGTNLNWESVITVFITGVLISIFASIYPARQAIRKKTVDVLRGVR